MSRPAIATITPSYNKPQYVLDTVKSIVSQTFSDWKYYIIENSTDDGKTREVISEYLSSLSDDVRSKIVYEEVDYSAEERASKYIPAHIVNKYYESIDADYIFYISDDDYVEPICFEKCIDWLAKNQKRKVCYFKMSLQAQEVQGDNSSFRIFYSLPGGNLFGNVFQHGGFMPLDKMDGGQIFISKEALDQMERPYFTEDTDEKVASHSDGLFLTKVAKQFKIHPIDYDGFLGHKRITKLSTWRKFFINFRGSIDVFFR